MKKITLTDIKPGVAFIRTYHDDEFEFFFVLETKVNPITFSIGALEKSKKLMVKYVVNDNDGSQIYEEPLEAFVIWVNDNIHRSIEYLPSDE